MELDVTHSLLDHNGTSVVNLLDNYERTDDETNVIAEDEPYNTTDDEALMKGEYC